MTGAISTPIPFNSRRVIQILIPGAGFFLQIYTYSYPVGIKRTAPK